MTKQSSKGQQVEKVRVIIEVRGGIVQEVYAGDFVDVIVVDWDNQEGGNIAYQQPPIMEGHMPKDTANIVAEMDAFINDDAELDADEEPEDYPAACLSCADDGVTTDAVARIGGRHFCQKHYEARQRGNNQ